MSEAEQIQVLCACCAADVTRQKHHRDRYGEHLCLACHEAGRKSPRAAWELQKKCRCVFCGAEVARSESHRNRYGERVCKACRAAGKRWSRRSTVRRTLRHWTPRLVFAAIAVAGLALAYIYLR
jgi:hypothetical protein